MRVGFVDSTNSLNKNQNNILVPLDFTNAICYGQTGSGKTSSFILPNIEYRILEGHSVIIFDYKGNMHLKVKAIAERHKRLKDVVEIGTLWGMRMNILDGLSEKEIDTLLNSSGLSSGYWDIASRALFKSLYFSSLELRDLYIFLKENNIEMYTQIRMFKESPTFSVMYELLREGNIEKYIHNIGGVIGLLHQLLIENTTLKQKIVRVILHFEKKLRQFTSELNPYKLVKEDDKDAGNHAVMNCLKNTIQDLSRVSFLNDSYAKSLEWLIQNKIVIINSENIGKMATQIINARLFSTLKKRAGKTNVSCVTIFLDEAHKVITKQTLPETSVCRESRFEYIMAVQDELLLIRNIGSLEIEEMLVNIAYVISYKNINDDRCKQLKPFYYLKDHIKAKAEPLFIDSDEEIAVEMLFQHHNNCVKRQTIIEKKGGYLENDTDLFGRDQAYYVDTFGHKSIVRVFPYEDAGMIDDNLFVEKSKSFLPSTHPEVLYERVNSVEAAIVKLIHLTEDKSKKEKIQNTQVKIYEPKKTIKMILRDTHKNILDISYFKAQKDVGAMLCKLRPKTQEEFSFFKMIVKQITHKDFFQNHVSGKLFLDLPYDSLLYVTIPDDENEFDVKDEKKGQHSA